MNRRGVRLRLLAALLAISAGAVALLVATLLIRSVFT